MCSNEKIKIFGIICTIYALSVSGKNIHQPFSLDGQADSLPLIVDRKHEDLFVGTKNRPVSNLDAYNTINSSQSNGLLSLYFEWSLHSDKEQQKNVTNCKDNSYITKEGNCETCTECRQHEVLISQCTQFQDAVCWQLNHMQLHARCINLFKRKHNHYVLKKYWISKEKWSYHPWILKCFSYFHYLSMQIQEQVKKVKIIQKRQANSQKQGNIPPAFVENVKEKQNNRTFISGTENQVTGSSGSSTASWVYISIGVSAVVLIATVSVLVVVYRRKRGRRIKIMKFAAHLPCSVDHISNHSMFTISNSPLERPVKASLCGESDLQNSFYPNNEYFKEMYKNTEPEAQITCDFICDDHHSPLLSCLSPGEKDDKMGRAMSSSFFRRSLRDDGNKLRGGNGDFQRRYVDVDYVHNDIDLHRQKHHNRNSNDWEQENDFTSHSNGRSGHYSLDREQKWDYIKSKPPGNRCRKGSTTSSSARSYISIPPTSPSENYIEAGSDDTCVLSERSTPSTKITWLTKYLKVDYKNEISSYQASLGTQTESDADITTPNCKTVFGTPWQFGGTFTSRGGRLQAKDSDVCLIIVANAIAKGVYTDIYGAIFTDTTEIRKKLDFPAGESLISPVVEYHSTPVNNFSKHVCVQLPHAMPEDFDESLIMVYTFTVDERGKVTLFSVPVSDKSNNEKHLDIYWEKGPDGYINISTTHFSGYFCTQCKSSSLPSICTMVFGSHVQMSPAHREVRVILYIWDRRLTIKDYLERFRKQEFDVDRQLLTDMQVPLLENASSDSRLVMRLEVMGEDEERLSWVHVSRPNGSAPMFKPLQARKLNEIVHCCRQTDPIRVEWALKNAPQQIPSAIFQCCIDIMHVHESRKDYETAMREDNDDLMRTFYVRDLKVMSRNHQELKPREDIHPADLKKALLEATEIAQTEKICQEFGIAMKDIGNFRKKYLTIEAFQAGLVDECLRRHGLDKFLNQLPAILDRLHFTQVLMALEKKKILCPQLASVAESLSPTKPVSPVKMPQEIVQNDRDITSCKSHYRRRSSSPNQRNRSNSPLCRRRSREDSRGHQKAELQQQVSDRSDEVIVQNNPTQEQLRLCGQFNRTCSQDRESQQHGRRSNRNRPNSPPSDHSVDDEHFIGSQNARQNRAQYVGQNIAERQPLKNQQSTSSRSDSLLSSGSVFTAESSMPSLSMQPRSTLNPSIVAHADPIDFAEPYPDEFLDSYLQETYKKELAVERNFGNSNSEDYVPYQNMRDGPYLSNSGPQAIPPDSGQVNGSSVSDPVSPYRKFSKEKGNDKISQSQDKDQTLKKELYGVSTVV